MELFAGRYGPYVKHGGVNATVPNRDRLDALTLDEAVLLLAAKGGKAAGVRKPATRTKKVSDVKTPAYAPAATSRTTRAVAAARVPAAKKPSTLRKIAKLPARTPRTAATPARKRTGAAKTTRKTRKA